MINLEIIDAMPTKTKILFERIASGNELNDFVLAGGTALEIYIKHRTSEDLDFFINKNIINNVTKNNIETLINRLDKEGFIITLIANHDDVQLDYMFGDVKVTFLASSLKLLEDANQYKNLHIASIEKIAAGKLYTILKYRIKSRDFYDVKYIMKHYNLSFGEVFDLMKKHYGVVNFSEDIINTRFLKMPLNIDDEGFESLVLKEKETFETLRNYFKEEIKKLNNKKMEIFHLSKEEIAKKINKKYGILRQSLLMELYNIGRHFMICDLNLVRIECDILYQDINGKTIFHLACDDTKFLEYLLFHIQQIPDNIKTICQNSGNQKASELIEFHRLLNRSLSKDTVHIDEIIKDKGIDRDTFFEALDKKITIFL